MSVSASLFTAAGEARSQLIAQLYKRGRAAATQGAVISSPIFLFPENEALDHLPLLEPLTPSEKAELSVAKAQQFVTTFDRSAIQPAVIEPHDLLWRIRNFFRLNV